MDRAQVDALLDDASDDTNLSMVTAGHAISKRALELIESTGASGELRRVLEIRIPELIAYQDAAYAARYATRVKAARERELSIGVEDQSFAIAVARNLYKLMAYKDEYEVAPLLLDKAARAPHPDLRHRCAHLLALASHVVAPAGCQGQGPFGPWFRPVLAAVAWARWLRGTTFDLAGFTHVRRLERALVAHYEALAHTMGQALTAANHAHMTALANLPGMVPGYEEIKARNVTEYLNRLTDAAKELGIDLGKSGPSTRTVADFVRG